MRVYRDGVLADRGSNEHVQDYKADIGGRHSTPELYFYALCTFFPAPAIRTEEAHCRMGSIQGSS